MTIEFEKIKQAVTSKRMDLDTMVRVNQQNEDNKRRQEEYKRKEEISEIEKKAIENKKIFENAGVVKLFEEIRDSGIIKYNNDPLYSKGYSVKTGLFGNKNKWIDGKEIMPYHPAEIRWGKLNFYGDCDCSHISLTFNDIPGFCDSDGRELGGSADVINLDILSNKKIGILEFVGDPNGEFIDWKRDQRKPKIIEKEIENIPNYITTKLLEFIK